MKDILLKDICKAYGTQPVLLHFSARFPAGQTTCIMGESGCGKTTLLHILMKLVRPDSGTIENMIQSIAAVFQEDRLCEGFSAAKNIRLTARTPLSDETIRSHMAQVGLGEDAWGKPVRELSGGMKRRVAILRAVLSDRDVLLLDEPFKGLDESTRALTAEYLRKSSAGKTVLMVTHDSDEVALMGGVRFEMKKAPQTPKE